MAFAKLACLNHVQQRLVFAVQIVQDLHNKKRENKISINFSI